jgi:transposase-like protein
MCSDLAGSTEGGVMPGPQRKLLSGGGAPGREDSRTERPVPDALRIARLEREVRELREANVILRRVANYLAFAEPSSP